MLSIPCWISFLLASASSFLTLQPGHTNGYDRIRDSISSSRLWLVLCAAGLIRYDSLLIRDGSNAGCIDMQVENPGDVATASTLAGIISDVKLSRSGRSPLIIFDIHALQERFYFGQNVLPLLESGIPLLRERLQQLPNQESITIAYPDEGAWKRFHFQFGGYEEVGGD